MTSFLYLSNNFFILDCVIHKIPRKCGMAGFYTIVSLLGLTFFIHPIKHSVVLTSIVIGMSRVASSINFFTF